MYKYVYTHFSKKVSPKGMQRGLIRIQHHFHLVTTTFVEKHCKVEGREKSLRLVTFKGIAMINTGSDQKHDPAKSPNDLGGKVSRFGLVCVYIYIDT